jgi:solute carrier family 30 (zinc transporter), member 9
MGGHGHEGDSSLKTVITAVAVNFIIMVAKYVGWALTMSPAMLAEAIHTTADVGNQVLLWIGISQSNRAATPEHPYGWGAARWMWNLMSAMGIFFLGCGVTAYHALHAFLHPDEPSHSPIGLIILGISFVLEGYSFWVAISGINKDRGDMPFLQYLKQGDDPTGVGVLLEDAAAIIGIIFAIIGVALSQHFRSAYPDAVATALIAALLGLVAIFLAKANGRLLVGASAGPKTEAKLRAALERDEVVERVLDLKTEVVGAGKMRVAAQVDLREKIIALRMQADLEAQAKRLADGAPAPQVLHDVAARAVVVAGHEVQRLNKVIDDATPEAAYVDLEIVG